MARFERKSNWQQRFVALLPVILRYVAPAFRALSPDAKWAVSPDFSRLNDMRPGYGYCGIPDPYFNDLAPTRPESGIWT